MVNYSNAKIYKLVNNVDDKIYVGSTTSRLSKRKACHKDDAKKQTNRKVYQHLNQIGWEHIDIILVENYECKNKEQLHSRERYWIETLKAELNNNIPTRTKKEYYEDNKEKLAQYFKERYENNKEKMAQYHKEYYQDNKEKLKQYYANNKEKIAQKDKIRYENNKELLNQKFQCECGGAYTHTNKTKHMKTQKHQKYIEKN